MKKVQPGDIVFHSGSGMLSHAIRRVTECPWSHVSLVVDVETLNSGTFTVLDVLDTRVVQSIDAHREDLTWHVRAPRFARSINVRHWADHMGVPYSSTREHVVRQALDLHHQLPSDYPTLELLAYIPFLRRTRLGRRILNRSPRMVCSALVAAAWHSMDFKWINGDGTEISPDWVGPWHHVATGEP